MCWSASRRGPWPQWGRVSPEDADHLPLYRQSQILARAGLDLHRAVLADWVGKAAFHLKPVVDRLAEHLKRSSKLFMPSRQIAAQSPAG
jgi:transposase